MVLKPEPLFEAVESLTDQSGSDDSAVSTNSASPAASASSGVSASSAQGSDGSVAIVLLSASGKLFRQSTARRLAGTTRVILLCGRYEGVDERVAEHLATDEISIGDFVLTGGELPAALIVDAVTRLLPGALGNEDSSVHESFAVAKITAETQPNTTPLPHVLPGTASVSDAGSVSILDWPHYTRPAEFRDWAVPDVLLSGNHDEIRRWRERMAWEKTRRNRPDLLGR